MLHRHLFVAALVALSVGVSAVNLRPLPKASLALSAAIAVSAPAIAGDECPPQYEVTAIIEGPDCGDTTKRTLTAHGLNNLGWVCGEARDCDGGSNDDSWYWTPEKGLILLPKPAPYYSSKAFDISDSGYVVGTMVADAPVVKYRAYRYHIPTGNLVFIEPPRSSWLGSEAVAVNEAGWVAGNVWENGKNEFRAFRWDGRAMVIAKPKLGPRAVARCMSSNGVIGGEMGLSVLFGAHPFLFDGASLLDLGLVPDAIGGTVADVQATGVVLATYLLLDGTVKLNHPFLWENGSATDLGLPTNCGNCVLKEMSELGEAVGACTVCSPPPSKRGMFWRAGTYYHLNDITIGSVPTITDGLDINENGQVLADWNGPGWVVLSPIPCKKFADLNFDGAIDGDDLGILLGEWNEADSVADLNGDQRVDGADLGLLLSVWDS
jgi:uncharacterized membrane protein